MKANAHTPSNMLKIGEIAQLLGITPKAIRHYHEMGLLPEPERAPNGYRLYGVGELMQLQKIIRLQKLGLTLKQIGFIFRSDNPDAVLALVLEQRRAIIDDELVRLQSQRATIDHLLDSDDAERLTQATHTPIVISAQRIIESAIKPQASGICDVVMAVESQALAQLDTLQWSQGYDEFWHVTVRSNLKMVLPHEHDFVLWLERFLALADLAPDDKQAQVWLRDLRLHPIRHVLAQMMGTPAKGILPAPEAGRIMQMTSLFLYETASPAQKLFLAVLQEG
jgi:DNA-binding transcriptional MerR regulator